MRKVENPNNFAIQSEFSLTRRHICYHPPKVLLLWYRRERVPMDLNRTRQKLAGDDDNKEHTRRK